MIKLALPGMAMILAEWLAFEILTLSASWISTSHLAAQAILGVVCGFTFQFPLAISVATSTRIANLVGASMIESAKAAAIAAAAIGCVCGTINMTVLAAARAFIPTLFTNEPDIIKLATKTFLICSAFQLFDSLATLSGGILRGIGRQKFGGWANLVCYYLVSLG